MRSGVMLGGPQLMVYSKISFKLFWVLNHTNQWNFGKMDEVSSPFPDQRPRRAVSVSHCPGG